MRLGPTHVRDLLGLSPASTPYVGAFNITKNITQSAAFKTAIAKQVAQETALRNAKARYTILNSDYQTAVAQTKSIHAALLAATTALAEAQASAAAKLAETQRSSQAAIALVTERIGFTNAATEAEVQAIKDEAAATIAQIHADAQLAAAASSKQLSRATESFQDALWRVKNAEGVVAALRAQTSEVLATIGALSASKQGALRQQIGEMGSKIDALNERMEWVRRDADAAVAQIAAAGGQVATVGAVGYYHDNGFCSMYHQQRERCFGFVLILLLLAVLFLNSK